MGQWFQLSPFAGSLLILVLGDIVTGLLLAAKQHRLNSRVGRDGMFRKAGMLLLLALCAALERINGVPLVEWVAAALALPELISIIENLTLLGVPVPPGLTKFFSLLPAQKQPMQPLQLALATPEVAPAAPTPVASATPPAAVETPGTPDSAPSPEP